MITVALCQTKGGSGKSTIAECLAVDAAKTKQTQLMDLDPQASSAKWWRRRGGPHNPMIVTDVKGGLAAYMVNLGKRRAKPVAMIIDTPGSMLGVIRDAIQVASVIIVPVNPSVKDWEAMDVVNSIIKTAGKRERALYVINRYRLGTDTSVEMVRALKESPYVAHEPLAIGLRTDYEKADVSGKVGSETNREAAKEIAALWNAVNRIAGHV